jgi:hypothetical protein
MTQLSLFEHTANQPYPLLVAQKWDFQLDYYDVNGNPTDYLYHAVHWTQGLGASSHTTWERIKSKIVYPTHSLKIKELPFTSTDGKTYQVDYFNQEACYQVAMEMRVTKTRPQLQEIRDYLAKSGAFVDWAKRNPHKAIENLSAYARQQEIEKLERAGYDETYEARRFKARHENIEVLKQLHDKLAEIVDNPNFAILNNERYLGIFGATASELKEILHTQKVRDSLGLTQLRTLTFAEDTLKDVIASQQHLSHEQAVIIIRQVLPPIGKMLKDLMQARGLDHITGQPLLAD